MEFLADYKLLLIIVYNSSFEYLSQFSRMKRKHIKRYGDLRRHTF
jgi:hypothetical protein